jgi:hypothetical protein
MPRNTNYLLIPMLLLLFGIARKINAQRQRRTRFNVLAIVPVPIAAFAALLYIFLTQSSCGGGGTSGGTIGTQAGTYTISVTATSTSNSAITHTTSLTLVVQ